MQMIQSIQQLQFKSSRKFDFYFRKNGWFDLTCLLACLPFSFVFSSFFSFLMCPIFFIPSSSFYSFSFFLSLFPITFSSSISYSSVSFPISSFSCLLQILPLCLHSSFQNHTFHILSFPFSSCAQNNSINENLIYQFQSDTLATFQVLNSSTDHW